jgi:hypothetical protein
MASTIVLGLNCSHDATACLARDGVVTAAIAEERLTRRKLHIMPRLSRDSAIVNPFSSLSAWVLRANDDGTYPERHIRLVADGSGYSYCEHQQRRSSLLGPAAPCPDLVEALSAYHVADYAVTAREETCLTLALIGPPPSTGQ